MNKSIPAILTAAALTFSAAGIGMTHVAQAGGEDVVASDGRERFEDGSAWNRTDNLLKWIDKLEQVYYERNGSYTPYKVDLIAVAIDLYDGDPRIIEDLQVKFTRTVQESCPDVGVSSDGQMFMAAVNWQGTTDDRIPKGTRRTRVLTRTADSPGVFTTQVKALEYDSDLAVNCGLDSAPGQYVEADNAVTRRVKKRVGKNRYRIIRREK